MLHFEKVRNTTVTMPLQKRYLFGTSRVGYSAHTAGMRFTRRKIKREVVLRLNSFNRIYFRPDVVFGNANLYSIDSLMRIYRPAYSVLTAQP